MFTFSNPRRNARFEDWPNGRHLTTCAFFVETHPKRGERVGRQTLDKAGRPCKPKYTTYCTKAAIVDGSDGRTYLLLLGLTFGPTVTIFASDVQHNAPVIDGESYIPADHPRHAELRAMVESAADYADNPPMATMNEGGAQ